jgi:hypothetical protein
MPNSMGQSTDKDKAGLCLFDMKFIAIERKINHKRCDSVWRHLPAAIFTQAVLSSSNSNNLLHSCRLLMQKQCGTINWQRKCWALLIQYEIHGKRKTNPKRCDNVLRHLPAASIAKALLSSSDSHTQLHSCSLLMLNRVGQSTDKDKAGLHSFGMKFTQEKARENDSISLFQWWQESKFACTF